MQEQQLVEAAAAAEVEVDVMKAVEERLVAIAKVACGVQTHLLHSHPSIY
jgi:hypothetical protein